MATRLTAQDREKIVSDIRRALLRKGFRQTQTGVYEGIIRQHGCFRYTFTKLTVEKQIQRCEFERKPGTLYAWERPDNEPFPYWWEDYGYGWLSEVSVDPSGRIRGMRRHKNIITNSRF